MGIDPNEHSDEPRPSDPRLEIPEVLRTPVRQPGEIPGEARPPKGELLGGLGVGFAIAFDFIGSIGAGVFIGWLLDRWQGSSPLWTLIGLGLGFVGAMFRIVRHSRKLDADAKRRRTGGSPPG